VITSVDGEYHVPQRYRRFVVEDDFARYGLSIDSPASRPRYLQIELTDLCNLACAGCVRAAHTSTGHHFGYRDFLNLLDNLPDLEHVSFVGAGEALILPDLARYVEACSGRGVFTSCNTNGLLIRRLPPVLDAGLGLIAISVDGADEPVLSAMRSGLRLGQLSRALSDALVLTEGGATRVSAAVTLSSRNIDTFPAIVAYVAGQGLREMSVESLHHWGNDKSLNGQSLFSLDPVHAITMIESGLEVADRLNLKLTIFDYGRLVSDRDDLVCPWPWDAVYVTRDGDVTPCCVHVEADDDNVVGNVHRASIDTIWSGAGLVTLRSLLRQGRGWSSCEGCVYRKEFGRVR
jgi:radical SAM protein with 4Fe4S-binding SPASM domain